jgi:hypothetical protein
MTAVGTGTARLAAAGGLLLLSAAVAGCQTGTVGTPVTGPGSPSEPSFPAARPSTSKPTASPPAAEVLPPDDSGYVFIETKSGQIRCQLEEQSVGCEAPFENPPVQGGQPANGVTVSADGSMRWIVGNLGDIPAVTIDYRTYSAVGWTIVATSDGIRFTDQATKHGMFVSIEKVDDF